MATALLLEQTKPQRIANAGWLLWSVVMRSDTTELPPVLDSQWDAVMARLDVAESGEWQRDAIFARGELGRWYRRHR